MEMTEEQQTDMVGEFARRLGLECGRGRDFRLMRVDGRRMFAFTGEAMHKIVDACPTEPPELDAFDTMISGAPLAKFKIGDEVRTPGSGLMGTIVATIDRDDWIARTGGDVEGTGPLYMINEGNVFNEAYEVVCAESELAPWDETRAPNVDDAPWLAKAMPSEAAGARELIEQARRVAAELCATAAALEAGLERDAQATREWTHATPVDEDAANYCNGVEGYLRGEDRVAEPSDAASERCRHCGKPIERVTVSGTRPQVVSPAAFPF